MVLGLFPVLPRGAVHKWRPHLRSRGRVAQKMTCDDMMTRGRGRGVSIPPKSDDVIYEQPLKALVARKVIRERMDYESYLGGRVK